MACGNFGFGSCFILHSSSAIMKEKQIALLLITFGCVYSVPLPPDVVSWSSVSDCNIVIS